MSLHSGTRIGPYHVVALLGKGGMGEVYRARDSKLGRDVAIKVLPDSLATDPERLARFEREARTLASLNHPNIAHVYGLEDAHGAAALVMEIIEGQSLADRIAIGALSIDEALQIARQIADALDAAHEQGIIHRDLKPANIRLRPDGGVKVLDFGLAKALQHESSISDVAPTGNSESPTFRTPAMTQSGVILGTAAYMSPEQARGKRVDKRADIWAFGCVLFEMLAGQRPFETGETVPDAVAAVLKNEPNWQALPHETPDHVRALLARCLEKNPAARLRDIGDARWELERRTPQTAAQPQRRWIPWIVAAICAAVAVAAWLPRLITPQEPRTLMLTIAPPVGEPLDLAGNLVSAPELSPDGSAVLYGGPNAQYLRRLDSLRVIRLPGAERRTNAAFWSGDSESVFFPVDAKQLVRVRLPDGAPEVVASLIGPSRGGSVSAAGTMLISNAGGLLWRSSNGGTLQRLQTGHIASGVFYYPEFLPDSEDFLFYRRTPRMSDGEIYLATLLDGRADAAVSLMKNETAGRFTPIDGGRLLFVKDNKLYSQRLNRTARALEGVPELLVDGVVSQPSNSVYRADFSVARNGTIAWRPGTAALGRITMLDRQGAPLATSGPPGSVVNLAFSPDGTRVLATGPDEQWLADVGQPGHLLLPHDASWFGWSQDASRIRGVNAAGEFVERHPEGGETSVLGQVDAPGRFADLSPDGLVALGIDGSRIVMVSLSGPDRARTAREYVDTGADLRDVRFSPDGAWVAYAASGIYVQPFPGPGRRRQIARQGSDPVWSGDMRGIYYLDGDAVHQVPIVRAGNDLAFGAAQRLFGGIKLAPGINASSTPLDVAKDGSRFVIAQAVAQPESDRIHVRIRVP